jgi:hypothetical protein
VTVALQIACCDGRPIISLKTKEYFNLSSQNIMEKAESRFLETQKKTAERNKATAEYVSEAKARSVKTAKLRELRLAKEEADRVEAALTPVKPKKVRVPRTIKGKTLFSRIANPSAE